LKFLLLTGCDLDFQSLELANITEKNKLEYCQFHNSKARGYTYDFLSCLRVRNGIPGQWFKIEKLLQVLPHYDYVFWSDVDAIIYNYYISLSDIIYSDDTIKELNLQNPVNKIIKLDKFQQSDIILICSPDTDNIRLNTGNFLIKNCSESISLLKKIYEQTDLRGKFCEEQSAFERVLFSGDSYSGKIKVLEKVILNNNDNSKLKDSFIFHNMGCDLQGKKQRLTEIEKIVYK